MNLQEKLVLEPSTNTHLLETETPVIVKYLTKMNGMCLTVNGKGLVTHGEHGVISTESKHIIKLNQQEVNPITKLIMNSMD